MVLPPAALPLRVGVVSLGMLSVLELPESEAAARSIVGGPGGSVSIVPNRSSDQSLQLPAASCDRAMTR